MLREEELNVSPDQLNQILLEKNKSSRDFSFIQNRIPSPLNNNFLLSEEQSIRHMRQPSEGFMSAAHNLMNQEEFRAGYLYDQDQILEEADSQSDGLDQSKITLFTNDNGEDRIKEVIIDNLDHNMMLTMGANTVQNTESNNDDYNYSESNYQYLASQSLGAIIQGTNQSNSGGGSFIGYNQHVSILQNLNAQNSQRGSCPIRNNFNSSGRDSATPFNYDENSLMNLSNTPTSVAMMMTRTSNLLNNNSKERIISSTKLNHKQQECMVQILEQQKEEEQDESMLPSRVSSNTNKFAFTKDGIFVKPQDEWPQTKKYNPYEMPLQRNIKQGNSSNPFSPLQMHQMEVVVPQDLNLFSRNKQEPTDQFLQQMQNQQPNQQQNLPQQNQDIEDEDVEDEIQLIKKKLDFSRLSSLQNLSQQQIYLGQNVPNSFLFQTYQSMSNQSIGNDTQHYSTYQNNNEEKTQLPFEELLMEHMKAISRNNEDQRYFKTYTNQPNNDPFPLINNNDFERYSIDTMGNMHQEPGISPPSRTKSSLNSNNRPPIQRQSNPQQCNQKQQTTSQSSAEIIQQNLMQKFQIDCINIFQNGPMQQYPLDASNIPTNFQVPPASRTNSTNSYGDSVIDTQQSQNQQAHLPHHLMQQQYTKQQPTTNKIRCQPSSDTPREPSTLMVDQQDFNNFTNQINQMKMAQIQNQIMQNHQYILMQQSQDGETMFSHLQSDETDDSREQPKVKQQIKQVKLKKKPGNVLQQATSKTRVGTSKPRNSHAVMKQPSKVSFPAGFMSKTMIISKDKILPAAKSVIEPVFKIHQTIENQPSSQIQLAQKYKQNKVKKIKTVATGNVILNLAQAQSQQNTGRSMPNSNQNSAQTSFLTSNTYTKKLPVKTTVKKIQPVTSNESSQIETKQVKKLKKKNKSIIRQHMHNMGSTQNVNQIIQVQKQERLASKEGTRCNTHRSISRPKSGFQQKHENDTQPIIVQNGISRLGKKKNSQQVFSMVNQNKENIRPGSSNLTKKKIHVMGHQLNHRPEELLQSFESIKLLNAQDLLKELQNQQQRLSTKNFHNLFTTIDTADISKRVKTEEHHLNNIRSMQTFDTGSEIDPYHILSTLDSQRLPKQKLTARNQNREIFDNLYKGSNTSQQNNVSTTANHMQKMQSPYNSKTMKNKFSSIKNKKGEVSDSHSSFITTNNKQSMLSQCASIDQINKCTDNNQDDQCRRCDELITLLKNTRFLAR